MELRSLSRLRGRAGVGVPPRFALFVWKEFPPPASHHSMRCDLPRKRERCSESAAEPIQLNFPLYRPKVTISTQFGFLPIGYSFSLVSLPVA